MASLPQDASIFLPYHPLVYEMDLSSLNNIHVPGDEQDGILKLFPLKGLLFYLRSQTHPQGHPPISHWPNGVKWTLPARRETGILSTFPLGTFLTSDIIRVMF